MHGHTLSREMEAWALDHMGQHDSPSFQQYLTYFMQGLTAKHGERSLAHDNAGRFGMSKAGGCTRASALKLLGYEGEPFSGSSQVTFEIGHLMEVMAIAILRAMGYEIEDNQPPVSIEPFMQSASDGLVWFGGAPTVLSVKSTGYKKSGAEWRNGKRTFMRRGFPELPFEGVRKAQPGWYAQAQAEMHGHGLSHALVVVIAKDIIKSMETDPYLGAEGNGSLSFYTEVIPYDPAFVKEMLAVWAEQWRQVQAGSAGPALFLHNEDGYMPLVPTSEEWQPNAKRTGSFNPCSYCDIIAGCRTALAKEAGL